MPHFKIERNVTELRLAQPFTIARGTKTTVRNVMVKLTAEGITGFGEAGPNKRYNEDAEKVCRFIDGLSDDFFNDVESAKQLVEKLDKYSAKSDMPVMQSAKSAVEMAWLDWWGKTQEKPLWELWSAPSNKTPVTSYTIGLDEIDVMQQKVVTASEYPILKVKLGTDRDREIIKGIRAITDKPIRVDANEGWRDLETAKEQIIFLEEQNIELVEQPMPAEMTEELIKLKKWSPLPLMADESFKGNENLDQIADAFDGINIKLSKIGSLVKARKVIEEAKKRNLEVMVGCMIESSLAISAGALIGTWADYVDLDGFLLIQEDPFEGLGLTSEKEIVLSDKAGLTVQPRG